MKKGINRHRMVRYTSQQNKVDIMMNKNLLKRARSRGEKKTEKPIKPRKLEKN